MNTENCGAYTKSNILSLIDSKKIRVLKNFKPSHISVSSLDVTIEDEAYEIKKLFKPISNNKETVRDILNYMDPKPFKVGDIMYPGKVYLAKASIDLDFDSHLFMSANAKSSSGRNFLLVRALTDRSDIFDGIGKTEIGGTRELWLTFEPLAYPIVLTSDETYLQIRISDKDTRMSHSELQDFLKNNPILFNRDTFLPYKNEDVFIDIKEGAIVSSLYAPANTHVGYVVKDNINLPVNFAYRDLDPSLFFDKVYAKPISSDTQDGFVELKKDKKYLLCTNEVLKIPTSICSELKILDPRLGLFFSHFAGFFDPGFFGTGTLEIIPLHDMTIRHKDSVAKFEFEYLKEESISYENSDNNYYGQIQTKLPKQFKNF